MTKNYLLLEINKETKLLLDISPENVYCCKG